MFSDTDRLIRQANILLPNGHFFRGDVQIRQGKIARIAEAIAPDPDMISLTCKD
ncbi:MAG: hypothetical protein AB4290_24165 [Spirulina sp.]